MVAGAMETDLEGPIALGFGGTATLTTGLLSSRVAVEGVDGVPTIWNLLIGELSGYSNVAVRRVMQILIVLKLVFLLVLEERDGALHWNAAVLFCIGWHAYCLVGSEALARSVRGDKLLSVPCRQLLFLAVCNCLLFLVYLVAYWATQPDVRHVAMDDLPVGIIIQTFPFHTSHPLALTWAVALTVVRIPMTLTWSLGLHLLGAKLFGALATPDPYKYRPLPQDPRPPVLSPGGAGNGAGNGRLGTVLQPRSAENLLAQTFSLNTESSELKYRFRHFCSVVGRLKDVGREVDPLATVVCSGQIVLAVLGLNCLVLGKQLNKSPFLTFYVLIMVLYVLYMVYCFWRLVHMIQMMQVNFLRAIDRDLLGLDLENQMERMRDNMQIRQVVLETPLGMSIFGGAIMMNNSNLVRLMTFFASVFFVLLNLKNSKSS